MSETFERSFFAGWGDMDFNAHMRNTAYLDRSADTRMLYFQERGFTMKDFMRVGIGPVILKDEVEYFRELKLLEEMRVSIVACGRSEDGSRFRLRNEFKKPNGQLVARVTSLGGWLDLAARKMIAPPPELAALLDGLPRSEDYEVLRSAVTKAL